MIEIVGRRIAEDQTLHHGRNEQAHPCSPVLEDGEQFLTRESDDAQDGCEHGGFPQLNRLRVAARLPRPRRAAMVARTSMLGTMTRQTLPARNSVCSKFT